MPTVTYFYPPVTIVLKRGILSIIASPYHILPYCIFWRVSKSMLKMYLLGCFTTKTPAAFNSPGGQIYGTNNRDFRAIALTNPRGSFCTRRRFVYPFQCNNDKTIKTVAGQVFKIMGMFARRIFSHVVYAPFIDNVVRASLVLPHWGGSFKISRNREL